MIGRKARRGPGTQKPHVPADNKNTRLQTSRFAILSLFYSGGHTNLPKFLKLVENGKHHFLAERAFLGHATLLFAERALLKHVTLLFSVSLGVSTVFGWRAGTSSDNMFGFDPPGHVFLVRMACR